MKKILICAGLGIFLSGCTRAPQFNSAIVALNDNKIIEGTVNSWITYDINNQIQITIDGTTYLTHSSNVILIAE